MNVLVLGGGGGIGASIIEEIQRRYPQAKIFATWYKTLPDVIESSGSQDNRIAWFKSDISSELDVSTLLEKVKQAIDEWASTNESESNRNKTRTSGLDWIINAVGFLHADDGSPEKTIRQLNPKFFAKNIEINTLPTLLLAKHFVTLLKKSQSPVFTTVSAKVGSIEDNELGGWTSYRCSKAALNMALKNISLEWRRSVPRACVAALHPGTTDTQLSMPFQSNVPDGKLFSPQKTAAYLVDIIATLTAEQTGKFLSWDGSEIPW